MPPYTTTIIFPLEAILNGNKEEDHELLNDRSFRTLYGIFKTPIIWANVVLLFGLHLYVIYGFSIYHYNHLYTIAVGFVFGWYAGFGVTAGAHRLWTHRTYKAKLPLRIFLIIAYAMAGQNRLVEWVKDHRVHHKFSETDADPHNSNRGFFFAHVGWLMLRKHPDVISKGKQLDFSDLYRDPVVVFFEKHYWTMKFLFCFIIPGLIPYLFCGESFYFSAISPLARLVIDLNITWSVNSAAHIFGNRPYNSKIRPAENWLVSFLAMGEGWHNYHHCFPWDYKTAEFGWRRLNATAGFIEFFEKIGWAYDLKTTRPETIKAFIKKHKVDEIDLTQ